MTKVKKTAGLDRAKRRRLEAGGWKIGTAAEFLKLTPEEEEYVEIKLSLVLALSELRERKGWTQVELARRIGSSQSRVAKMENGDRTVSIDLLLSALIALGVRRRDLARILAVRAA
jgi:ribosome-binding protein aMBF1 (putative translation factor)